MKAYQILMFMLIFNFSVFMIQAIPIYNLSLTPIWTDSGLLAALSITAVFASLIGGAVVSLFTRNATAMQYAMYMLFSGSFWVLYLATMRIFNGIIVTVTNQGISFLLLTGVSAIIAIVFSMGLIQLVTGSWKGLY